MAAECCTGVRGLCSTLTFPPSCPLPLSSPAVQVFIQMYRHHPQFHVLLEGMDTETADSSGGTLPGGSSSPEIGRASSLLAGTFTTAALNALSISEDVLPPPEQLLAMMEASGGCCCVFKHGLQQCI